MSVSTLSLSTFAASSFLPPFIGALHVRRTSNKQCKCKALKSKIVSGLHFTDCMGGEPSPFSV